MVCAFPVLFVFQELCAGRVPGIVRMFNSCRSTCINQAVSVTSALPLPFPLAAWSWWQEMWSGRSIWSQTFPAVKWFARIYRRPTCLSQLSVMERHLMSPLTCLCCSKSLLQSLLNKLCTLVLSSYSKVELFDFSFLSLKGCIGCRVHILKESVVWDFVAVIIQGARIKPAKSFHPKKSSLQFRLIGLV